MRPWSSVCRTLTEARAVGRRRNGSYPRWTACIASMGGGELVAPTEVRLALGFGPCATVIEWALSW